MPVRRQMPKAVRGLGPVSHAAQLSRAAKHPETAVAVDEYQPRPAAAGRGFSAVAVEDLIGATPDWQELALCPQTDQEAFFPEKGGSTREAKQVCSRCEVRAECLEFALGNNERFGIWGGLSERERRKLKRHVA